MQERETARWTKALLLRLLPDFFLQALKKRHYLANLRRFRLDEEPDLRVVLELVRPGDRVLDVGANIGVYTKVLSERVGPDGAVVSLEPMPPTFDILAANVRALGLANVTLLHCAASDAPGEALMEVPRYGAGGENFYQARLVAGTPEGSLRRVRVPLRTLDSIHREIDGRIAFVKCDVEGHELACLRGAEELCRESQPAWLLEVSGDPDEPDSPAAALFAILAGHGYRPFWFDGRQLVPRRAGDRSVNYFFLGEDHRAALSERGLGFAGAE